MESLLVNLALLALHFWLATENYKNEKYEAAMIHSCGMGVHLGFFLLDLIKY